MGVIINSESNKGIPKEAKPLGFSFSFFLSYFTHRSSMESRWGGSSLRVCKIANERQKALLIFIVLQLPFSFFLFYAYTTLYYWM